MTDWLTPDEREPECDCTPTVPRAAAAHTTTCSIDRGASRDELLDHAAEADRRLAELQTALAVATERERAGIEADRRIEALRAQVAALEDERDEKHTRWMEQRARAERAEAKVAVRDDVIRELADALREMREIASDATEDGIACPERAESNGEGANDE